MLRNPDGARLWEHLDRLFAGGIQVHGQVVLVPGVNDGAVLERTVEEVARHYPNVLSLAIVPVGLTGWRERLPDLPLVSAGQAQAIVRQVRGWQRRFRRDLGARFVYASDEMYLLAGSELPGVRSYEEESQYENGVGMVARLRADWQRAARKLPACLPGRNGRPRRVTVATGTLAAPVLQPLVDRLNEVEGLEARLAPVENHFFGPSVTVAGLLTGSDLVEALEGQDLGDELLLPDLCLRAGRFLDDQTVKDVEAALGVPIRPVAPRAGALAAAAIGGAAGDELHHLGCAIRRGADRQARLTARRRERRTKEMRG
jgi:putative radical SAM enzyme (TIGR03279 family)